MSGQKRQGLWMRMTAGLVAGVTTFVGICVCAQATPAQYSEAPVGANKAAAPQIETVTGYMTSTDQWQT